MSYLKVKYLKLSIEVYRRDNKRGEIVKNKIVAGLCCLMLVSATLFAAGSAIAGLGGQDDSFASMMETQGTDTVTTGGMSILMMMPAILGAVKAGLKKMEQNVK